MNGILSSIVEKAAELGPNADGDVYRVAELNRSVRHSLETRWGAVWVEGELSDVTKATSGHCYFTLNDPEEPAQIRVVMFRGDARKSEVTLQNGELVRLQGTLSLYEPRGSFQLIARKAVAVGKGDLHAEFERTRKKLEAEGLLDPAKKRALPRVPKVVGVVTSSTGAAIHDIVQVAMRRCPVRIVVANCLVQGTDAPASIVQALTAIQRLAELDVVIIGRGGGSAEDLFAFNSEAVARAMAACRVPIVSAVGHEVDITIADLVADVRAATPSQAAELVVPDANVLRAELSTSERHLMRALEVKVGRERLRLDRLSRRLLDPRRSLGQVRLQFHNLVARLQSAARNVLRHDRRTLQTAHERVVRLDPRKRLLKDRAGFTELVMRLRTTAKPNLQTYATRLETLRSQIMVATTRTLEKKQKRFSENVVRLEALSPLKVLGRGYAIALHEPTGKALLHAKDAKKGDRLAIRLYEGTVISTVEST